MIFTNPARFAFSAHHEKIIKTFYHAGAFNSFNAISPSDYGITQGPHFRRMVRNRILVPIHDGRYYLSEARVKDMRKKGQELVGILLMLIAIIVLIVFFWRVI